MGYYDDDYTDKQRQEQERSLALEKQNELLTNIVDILKDFSDVNQKRYSIDVRKETRLSREALFEKLNEISQFLTDCKTQNIRVDTSELDQIHFRAYSLTKLDEDVRKYIELVKKYQNQKDCEQDKDKFLEERNKIIDNIPKFLSPYFDYLFPFILVFEPHFDSWSTIWAEITDLENNEMIIQDTYGTSRPLNYAGIKVEYRHYGYRKRNFELKSDISQIQLNTKIKNSSKLLIYNPHQSITIPVNFVGNMFIPYKYTDLKSKIISACNGDEQEANKIYSKYKDMYGALRTDNVNALKSHIKYMKENKEEFLELPVIRDFDTRYLNYLIDSYDAYATALVNMKRQVLEAQDGKSLNFTPCKKD